MEDAQERDLLGALELGAPVCMRDGLTVYNGRTESGDDVLVAHLDPEPSVGARDAFSGMVRYGALGGLTVLEATGNVAIAQPGASGTVAHLPALSWPLNKRVGVFRQIVEAVERFHAEGHAVGSTRPDFILLDENLKPFLAGPMFAPPSPDYASPEVERGMRADHRSDVYSLGRLLYFVLTQDTPPHREFADPPLLEELMKYPAGLSRIVRKAVLFHPEDRYPSAAELLEDLQKYGRYQDVGLPHSDAEEKNFGGLSMRPEAENPRQEARPKDDDDPKVLDKLAEATAQIQEIKPFRLGQSTRAILLTLGTVGVLIAFGINYVQGDPLWVKLALSVTAGLVGFALFSPGIEREQMLRTLFAAFLASAMLALDPAPYVAHLAQRAGLSSPNAKIREQSAKAQTDRGQTELSRVDLTGADLKFRMFMASNLEGASFERADLTNATFFGAKLEGARFKGAKLFGTRFDQSPIDGVTDFDLASCDEATLLPAGWGCVNGHPKKGAKTKVQAAAKSTPRVAPPPPAVAAKAEPRKRSQRGVAPAKARKKPAAKASAASQRHKKLQLAAPK